MPCEELVGIDLCPRPAITNCADCLLELCSAHIIECDICGRFICQQCLPDHDNQHERKELAKPTRAELLKILERRKIA